MAKAKKTKADKVAEAKADKPKPQQMKIPGTERKSIAEVDKQADKYRKARDKRMEQSLVEAAEKKLLLELVKKHALTKYIFEDDAGDEFEVEYKTDENVKVKRVKDEDDAGDAE